MSDSDFYECTKSEDFVNDSNCSSDIPVYKSICITDSSTCTSSNTSCTLNNTSCTSASFHCTSSPCKKKCKNNYRNPDICTFRSIISPLMELKPLCSKHCGPIEFHMRRKNKVVTLQWEPFSAVITTSGISYLTVCQTIANTPSYPVSGVYNLEYNGVLRQAPVVISNDCIKGNILLYLNSNGTSENVTANDSIVVKGGCVSWIVSC